MGIHPVHVALSTGSVKNLISIRARQLVRQSGFRRHEQVDVEQDLAAYVLGKAHYFDPTRACVSTFIDRVVQSGIVTIWRQRRRLKHAECLGAISLERTHVQHGGQDQTTLSRALSETDLHRRTGQQTVDDQQRMELASDVASVLADLPEEVRQVALRLADASEAAIAQELGISRRRVRTAVNLIREQFEKANFPKI